METVLNRVLERAAVPVSAASAAVFRIFFGLLACLGALRFLANGWVDSLYLDPRHHLTYAGFEWIRPLPAPWMHFHVAALAVLGICIAIGYRYRLAATLYAIGFAYAELIDAALYLNHYWWVTIASFLLMTLPLDTMWSVKHGGNEGEGATIPAWVVWALRGQLAVVYIFAGTAKLQADWLFEAMPMKVWLADSTDVPLIGHFLDDTWVAYATSWAGAIFDCTIVGWLLWRKGRPIAYLFVISFHLATAVLFHIGMFPFIMICGTLVFFAQDWPLRLLRRVRVHVPASSSPTVLQHSSARLPVGALALFALVEIAVPLRHFAYAGDVRWTDEGYYGSWRVMLTEKDGDLEFHVHDPETNQQWDISPSDVLTEWQARQASVRPDLLVATAKLIADDFRSHGHHDVEVRADAFVSFNGRPNQRIIDPTVDLSKASRAPGHKAFVLSLEPAVRSR